MLATGLDNSCKLSLYFNLGCITPRQVHAALQEQESIEAGKETLLMHLRIRHVLYCIPNQELLHSQQTCLAVISHTLHGPTQIGVAIDAIK